MHRLRFTLAQVMAVVLYFGFGLAALRNADEIWASATYTLAFLILSFAPLGVLARKGKSRLAWAGFAIFGWSRFLVGVLPPTYSSVFGLTPSPGFLTEQAFMHLMEYLAPTGGFTQQHEQVFRSLDIIFFSLIGAFAGRLLAGKDVRRNPEENLPAG